MVDNFEIIKPLLDFSDKDTFYFLQVLQRKKDHKQGKVNGTNNNARLIKAYYIKSQEHLEFVKPEIIEICNIFNARAGINLTKRSFERIAFHTLKKITDCMINREYTKIHRAYNSSCGSYSAGKDKRWILDIDKGTYNARELNEMLIFIERNCRPEGDKFIARIPSKTGTHIITKPFDIMEFKSAYGDIDIQKDNPTNLFCP